MRRYIVFERNQASIIQNGYCCAGCWNRVICGHDPQGDFMDCETDDCNLPGLVTNRYVEKRLQESEGEYRIAQDVLGQSLEWMKRMTGSHSIEENMRKLGF